LKEPLYKSAYIVKIFKAFFCVIRGMFEKFRVISTFQNYCVIIPRFLREHLTMFSETWLRNTAVSYHVSISLQLYGLHFTEPRERCFS